MGFVFHSRAALEETVAQQLRELEDLKERNASLLSQVELHAEPTTASPPAPLTIDNETQTDDRQHEKLAQVNSKLKRVLQGFKEKLHQLVHDQPDLFDGVSEETSERLDHLIATVANQAAQLDALRTDYEQQVRGLQR